jgi:DNA-binding NtrC family response regulator
MLYSLAMDELDQKTTRADRPGTSVVALKLEVVAGPDAGASRIAETDRLTVGTAEGNELVLTDPTVSRYHLELSRAADGIRIVDHGSTNGTLVAGVRVGQGTIGPGAVLTLGHTQVRVSDAQPVVLEMHDGEQLGRLRGRSPVMRRLMAKVASIARANVSVLIVGETGTGKELVARALHELGPRSAGPFVTLDCGAIPPSLVASELFGHVKGAYTGAHGERRGAFELANGGTLFLDEVGELPSTLQPMLLGALERRRFRPVGSEQERTCDVRVVAATNRDLREEVNAGGFRPDLYYRLAVVTLFTPPLRERPEDIPLLLDHLLAETGHDGPHVTLFDAERLAQLARHRWPGNVRELRNLVEATIAIGEVPDVHGGTPASGGALPSPQPASSSPDVPYKDARAAVLRDFERTYLSELLARTSGNVSEAARVARMNRSYLIELLHKHGLR